MSYSSYFSAFVRAGGILPDVLTLYEIALLFAGQDEALYQAYITQLARAADTGLLPADPLNRFIRMHSPNGHMLDEGLSETLNEQISEEAWCASHPLNCPTGRQLRLVHTAHYQRLLDNAGTPIQQQGVKQSLLADWASRDAPAAATRSAHLAYQTALSRDDVLGLLRSSVNRQLLALVAIDDCGIHADEARLAWLSERHPEWSQVVSTFCEECGLLALPCTPREMAEFALYVDFPLRDGTMGNLVLPFDFLEQIAWAEAGHRTEQSPLVDSPIAVVDPSGQNSKASRKQDAGRRKGPLREYLTRMVREVDRDVKNHEVWKQLAADVKAEKRDCPVIEIWDDELRTRLRSGTTKAMTRRAFQDLMTKIRHDVAAEKAVKT
jgi:hypothetical protein